LSTSLGQRQEPVTYWFTVGDRVVRNKFEQRLVELRLGLTGQVPDGLLFRVSSIDANPTHAYQVHDAFVKAMLAAVPPVSRTRLSGLGGAPG
jgi:EpsI family protein